MIVFTQAVDLVVVEDDDTWAYLAKDAGKKSTAFYTLRRSDGVTNENVSHFR